ncbi:MAG: NADH-quinone oxidoreductase subunit C [Candidatus Levybacteria bacterium]|nr:NADH-quinone oxidoreductase subunit C [Candidatus Levybacteria bacterium]
MTDQNIINKYLNKKIRTEKSANLILFQVEKNAILSQCLELSNNQNLQLKTINATDERSENGCFKIFYIFGIPGENVFLAPYIRIEKTYEFPSITPFIHQASFYELEIYTFFGLKPIGHPLFHPVLLHENWPSDIFPLRKDFAYNKRPREAKNPPYEFQIVKGEGIYEIPVGPVHAGIIEPGHFRFSVAGEEIVSLEPMLGYTHKGSEKLFEVLSFNDKLKLSERISGDTSFTHSLAYCQAIETLGNTPVPSRAKYLRVIYSELERLANHLNDIGFIINDTAFSFGGSNGPRLKEEVMQLCEMLTGSRFLRGVNTIGGVTKDIPNEKKVRLEEKLRKIRKDFEAVIEVIDDSESVQNRLKGTGTLGKQVAIDHGVVGVAARAIGLMNDARIDYPYASYENLEVKISHQTAGDVHARFYVRISEVYTSIDIITKALNKLPQGAINSKSTNKLQKNAYAVGITEGWRGDIVYFITTDNKGEIARVGVRDASIPNWSAVPHAVVGNIVPDFPLINKSFNLSYSGFDR